MPHRLAAADLGFFWTSAAALSNSTWNVGRLAAYSCRQATLTVLTTMPARPGVPHATCGCSHLRTSATPRLDSGFRRDGVPQADSSTAVVTIQHQRFPAHRRPTSNARATRAGRAGRNRSAVYEIIRLRAMPAAPWASAAIRNYRYTAARREPQISVSQLLACRRSAHW